MPRRLLTGRSEKRKRNQYLQKHIKSNENSNRGNMDPFFPSRPIEDLEEFNPANLESLVEDLNSPIKKTNTPEIKEENKIVKSYKQLKSPHKATSPSKLSHDHVTVRTVGQIRKAFESEQLSKWFHILKMDQLVVNRSKCSNFFYGKYQTRIKNMFGDNRPLTKCCWDYISSEMNFPRCILSADGKKVRLPGCIDGKFKNITYSSYKIMKKKKTVLGDSKSQNQTETVPSLDPRVIRKRGLLSTMNLDFKPGPLSKKPKLNNSKDNSMEDLKLVTMPSVCLEVFPRIGVKLDPTACNRLLSVRNSSGVMDEKWAEFATSVLETDNENSSSYTFVLPYENNQNRILFRKDPEFKHEITRTNFDKNKAWPDLHNLNLPLKNLDSYPLNDNIDRDVTCVLRDILKSVSIGEIQNYLGVLDEDYAPVESNSLSNNPSIDNAKLQKKNRELSRLDVTVMDVSDNLEEVKECKKECCRLGCVCSSLRTNYLWNEHCGRIDCMLDKCRCNFGKSNNNCGSQNEISGTVVANLQHHMNRYLAKEEQKFRRTVIKTKDNTIVVGASRRGLRLPRRYQDFDVSEQSPHEKDKLDLYTICIQLNKLPPNLMIEPLCMVHSLYRCFCQGKMTQGTSLPNYETHLANSTANSCDDKEPIKPVYVQNTLSSESLLKTSQSKNIGIATSSTNKVNSNGDVTSKNRVSKRVVPKKPSYSTAPIVNKTITHVEDVVSESVKRKYVVVSTNTKKPVGGIKKICLKSKNSLASENSNKLNDPKPFSPLNETNNIVEPNRDVPNTNLNLSSNAASCDSDTSDNSRSVGSSYKEIVQEAVELYKNPNRSCVNNLPQPIFKKLVLYKWQKLVSDFQSGNIFLWVTESEPYRVFATSCGRVILKQTCLPIVFGKPLKKNILVKHSSLKYLLCCDATAFAHVAFVGRKFAWEFVCSFNEVKDQQLSQVVFPRITSVLNSSGNKTLLKEGAAEKPSDPMVKEKKANEDAPVANIERSPKSVLKEPFNKAARVIQQPAKAVLPAQPKPATGAPESCTNSDTVQKYHWLSLHIGSQFNEILVVDKNFKISYSEVMGAMAFAEKTGKTCKFPNGPLIPESIPEFGAYAIPGNNLQNIFLGPCVVGEKFNIKISPKGNNKSNVTGMWTKQLNDPRIIIWNNNKDQSKDSVLFLGKPFTTFKPSAKSHMLKQNIFNFLRLENKSPKKTDEKETTVDDKKPKDSQDNVSETSCEENKSEDDEDDVVFVPNNNSIIELSESEDDSS